MLSQEFTSSQKESESLAPVESILSLDKDNILSVPNWLSSTFASWWSQACKEESVLLPFLCSSLFGETPLTAEETQDYFANVSHRVMRSYFVRNSAPFVSEKRHNQSTTTLTREEDVLSFLQWLASYQSSFPQPTIDNLYLDQTFFIDQDVVWEGDRYLVNCNFIHINSHIKQHNIQCTGRVVILMTHQQEEPIPFDAPMHSTEQKSTSHEASDRYQSSSSFSSPLPSDTCSFLVPWRAPPLPVHFAADEIYLCELGPSTLPTVILRQLHFIPLFGKKTMTLQRAAFWSPLFQLWQDGEWTDSHLCSHAPVNILINYKLEGLCLPSTLAENDLGLLVPHVLQCGESLLRSVSKLPTQEDTWEDWLFSSPTVQSYFLLENEVTEMREKIQLGHVHSRTQADAEEKKQNSVLVEITLTGGRPLPSSTPVQSQLGTKTKSQKPPLLEKEGKSGSTNRNHRTTKNLNKKSRKYVPSHTKVNQKAAHF